MIIFKVITIWLEWEKLEKVNNILGCEPFNTDNWCEISDFEEHPELKEFLSEEEYQALINGQTDYIAFRLDN